MNANHTLSTKLASLARPSVRLLFGAATLAAMTVGMASPAAAQPAVEPDPTIVTTQGHPTCDGKLATILGTPGNDLLVGTPGPDVIIGFGGNDRIYGIDGDDLICAGPGDDTVYAGLGNDKVFGGPGTDRLYGEAGNDWLIGGSGDDNLDGGPHTLGDRCDGGPHIAGDAAVACESIINVP